MTFKYNHIPSRQHCSCCKKGLEYITTAQMYLLLENLQEQGSGSVYKKLEEILLAANPAFCFPKKWSNLTRTVHSNVSKKIRLQAPVLEVSATLASKADYIGPICETVGLKKKHFVDPEVSSVSGITLSVGCFYELCMLKKREKKCFHDLKQWLRKVIPELDLSTDRLRYIIRKIKERYNAFSKNKLSHEMEMFKGEPFSKFVHSLSVKQNKSDQELVQSKQNIKKLQCTCSKLAESNKALHDENTTLWTTVHELGTKMTKMDMSLHEKDVKIRKLNSLQTEHKHLQEDLVETKRKATSLKKDNLTKSLIRKKKKVELKENLLCKRELKWKQRVKKMKARVKDYENTIKNIKNEHKIKSHKYSQKLSYASSIKRKMESTIHNQSVELENIKQNMISVNKELFVANEQINMLTDENRKIDTKDENRYNDNIRTCVMELHGMDISTNKISNVIKSVSETLFDKDVDVPSRTTVQNICDESHVVAKRHVSDVLNNCSNFDIFSDGTARDGKKILNVGVHTRTSDSKCSSLLLGYKPVAREDSETVANVIKHYITEYADSGDNCVSSLLSSLTSMMSDRSSVMKKTNEILDEWRTEQLKVAGKSEIEKLNFFYCSAHVLLGFHNQIVKDLALNKQPMGRDLDKKFSRFRSSEPPAVRLVRTASEVFGPRGDEKNGCRQQWLAYMAIKSKPSKIISYRGNRFNNLFTGAVSIIHHVDDIKDFLQNYIDSPNLKLQSILLDISSNEVLSQVASLALVSIYIAEPYWNLVNSNEHYLDLYKFIGPLHDKLNLWSDSSDELFADNMEPLFDLYPHSTDNFILSFAKTLPEINKNIETICKSLLLVVKRQLADQLPLGRYGDAPDEKMKECTKQSKLTNIPSENLFGDLDSSIRRKPNASLRHHSSVTMFKRNRTAAWLKQKSKMCRQLILSQARKKSKISKQKEQMYEKEVMHQRKEMIKQTKMKKLKMKQKKQQEYDQIEQKIKKMGGIVRSRNDIDSLLSVYKTVKAKKEVLRVQLLYCKTFLNINIPPTDYLWSKTVVYMKEALVTHLKLDHEKTIVPGCFVAVSYEDNWYPGEVINVSEDNVLKVRFMTRKSKNTTTFIWPQKDDIQDVENKFVIFSHFEILPSPGLRFWLVPDFDAITTKHNSFVKNFF